MIRILKHGKPKLYVRRFVCDKCGCVFLADRDEYISVWDYLNHTPSIAYECECPCCHCLVFTKSEEEVVNDL